MQVDACACAGTHIVAFDTTEGGTAALSNDTLRWNSCTSYPSMSFEVAFPDSPPSSGIPTDYLISDVTVAVHCNRNYGETYFQVGLWGDVGLPNSYMNSTTETFSAVLGTSYMTVRLSTPIPISSRTLPLFHLRMTLDAVLSQCSFVYRASPRQ